MKMVGGHFCARTHARNLRGCVALEDRQVEIAPLPRWLDRKTRGR